MHCKICQINFVNEQSLNRHYIRKHKRSIVTCKICNKIFNSKFEECVHRNKFHRLIFRCKYCEKTFGAKSTFYRHVREGHAEPQIENVNLPNSKRKSPTLNLLATPTSSQAVVKKSFLSLKGKQS